MPNITSLGVCFKKLYLVKFGAFASYSVKFTLFTVSGLKDEKLIKSKPTWKLKHAISILESFEYFYQMSSKSIPTISSHTVSKLVHFWDTVYYIILLYRNQLTYSAV